MKVIDLLVKIANGEIKDKTKFRIHWGDMYRDFYYDGSEENQLQCLKNCSDDYSLYDDIKLNDEVEIIEDTPKEDKKIEKLDLSDWWEITSSEDCKPEMLAVIFNKNVKAFSKKINEIIDKINGE